MRWLLIFVAALSAVSRLAVAQPVAEPPPLADAPGSEPPVVVDPRTDAAWQLYHDAFGALLAGDRRRATELLAVLQRDHAAHPAAALARRVGLDVPRETARAQRAEQASAAARAELALFQTLHGIAVGIELCVVLDCGSAEGYVGLSFAAGGVGAIVSLHGLPRLTSGERALLNTGTAWGALNGAVIAELSDTSQERFALALLAGQGAGLLTGALLFEAAPTAGQVALASSGGQWLGALTGLTLAAVGPDDLDGSDAAALVLAAADVGLIAGGYAASRLPTISRAQTLVIDAGGIVGGVGGAGLSLLIADERESRATPGLAALGAVAGLGVAAYLTRHWDDRGEPESAVHAAVLPVPHGRGASVGIAGRW